MSEDAELDAKRAEHHCVKALKQLFQDFESQLKGHSVKQQAVPMILMRISQIN